VTTYERALELAPPGHPRRPQIHLGLAEVTFHLNRFEAARGFAEQAIAGFQGAGEHARAADSRTLLYMALGALGVSHDEQEGTLAQAIDELEALPPGPELVHAYAMRASFEYVVDRDHAAIAWADKAVSVAEQLGLALDPRSLRVRGAARWFTGDQGGLDDLQRAIALARERGLVREAALGHNELSNVLAVSRGPAEGLRALDEGVELARRSGHPAIAVDLEAYSRQELLYDLGRWSDLISEAHAYLAGDRAEIGAQSRTTLRILVCEISIWRGDLSRASEVVDGLAESLIAANEPQLFVSGYDVLAHLAIARGDAPAAADILRRVVESSMIRSSWSFAGHLPELTRLTLMALGLDAASELAGDAGKHETELSRVASRMVEAELAEARGELDRAADLYAEAEVGWRIFSVPERAQALLGRGRCRLAQGDLAATDDLRSAREVFASLDARRFLSEVDALLQRSVGLSA
jgi:tetratricopeptide (TPR) repeat protein